MAIEYRRPGRHGVLVSNLCLGTMNFGWHTDPAENFRIMDRALELGVNFFDTADVYGWGGGRRDAVVLATKVFNPVKRKANRPEPNSDGRSLSAYKIRKHCEGSLGRLGTMKDLDSIFPGLGGEAPKAYAWQGPASGHSSRRKERIAWKS
jgi:NDP-hexose 2,3-enoyl reductase